MKSYRKFTGALAVTGLVTLGVLAVAPVSAHHSFALYNNEVTKVFTGVVTRVNPDANHLQIFFAPDECRAHERGARRRWQAHHLGC